MKKIAIIVLMIYLAISPALSQNAEFFLNKAFEHSPVLKSKTYGAKAASESYKQESIFQQNPVFSLGYSNVPISEWPALDKHAMSGISLGVSQYIATPWEDYYRTQKKYQQYLSEKESLHETKNLLAFQVQSAFQTISFLYKKKQILGKNRDVLKDILRLAESLVSVNKMSSAHLLKLRADISVLENRIIEVDGALSKAKAIMEKLCGTIINWETAIDSNSNKWIDMEFAQTRPSGFSYKNHPVYKKVYAVYEAGKANRKLSTAQLAPGVTVGFEYRIRQEIPMKDDGEDFISFKVSTPIPLYYPIKDRHKINAAAEKEQGQKEILRSVVLDLESKWKGESDNHNKIMSAFINFEKAVLPGYWAAYQAQFGSLAAGTVNLLDVLDSYRLYLKASLEDARLYRDLMISKLKLNYLLYVFPGKDMKTNNQGGKEHENNRIR